MPDHKLTSVAGIKAAKNFVGERIRRRTDSLGPRRLVPNVHG
jgi:hypothetical protein